MLAVKNEKHAIYFIVSVVPVGVHHSKYNSIIASYVCILHFAIKLYWCTHMHFHRLSNETHSIIERNRCLKALSIVLA